MALCRPGIFCSPLRLLDGWYILTWWDFLYLGPRQLMWFSVFMFFFASCCFLCCYWSLRIFSIIADWRCPLTWWCLYDCHILLPPFFYFFHFQYAGFLHKNNGLFPPAILSDMEFCVMCFSFLYLLYSICSNIRHIMFICICQQLIQC